MWEEQRIKLLNGVLQSAFGNNSELVAREILLQIL